MKQVNKQELEQIVKESSSYADVCRALEVSPRGSNYARVKKLIKDLDISHFNKSAWNKGRKIKSASYQKAPIQQILIENSPHTNSGKLRIRLIKEGLKENKCEVCGCTESLELHHINGNHQDNRLENLQILCANCHRKTDTFRGKGIRAHKAASDWFISDEEAEQRHQVKLEKRRVPKNLKKVTPILPKICPSCGKEFQPSDRKQKYCSPECYHNKNDNRPDIISLLKAFKEYKSFVKVGTYFSVTDNAVRKWCKLYKLPIHSKELHKVLESIEIK